MPQPDDKQAIIAKSSAEVAQLLCREIEGTINATECVAESLKRDKFYLLPGKLMRRTAIAIAKENIAQLHQHKQNIKHQQVIAKNNPSSRRAFIQQVAKTEELLHSVRVHNRVADTDDAAGIKDAQRWHVTEEDKSKLEAYEKNIQKLQDEYNQTVVRKAALGNKDRLKDNKKKSDEELDKLREFTRLTACQQKTLWGEEKPADYDEAIEFKSKMLDKEKKSKLKQPKLLLKKAEKKLKDLKTERKQLKLEIKQKKMEIRASVIKMRKGNTPHKLALNPQVNIATQNDATIIRKEAKLAEYNVDIKNAKTEIAQHKKQISDIKWDYTVKNFALSFIDSLCAGNESRQGLMLSITQGDCDVGLAQFLAPFCIDTSEEDVHKACVKAIEEKETYSKKNTPKLLDWQISADGDDAHNGQSRHNAAALVLRTVQGKVGDARNELATLPTHDKSLKVFDKLLYRQNKKVFREVTGKDQPENKSESLKEDIRRLMDDFDRDKSDSTENKNIIKVLGLAKKTNAIIGVDQEGDEATTDQNLDSLLDIMLQQSDADEKYTAYRSDIAPGQIEYNDTLVDKVEDAFASELEVRKKIETAIKNSETTLGKAEQVRSDASAAFKKDTEPHKRAEIELYRKDRDFKKAQTEFDAAELKRKSMRGKHLDHRIKEKHEQSLTKAKKELDTAETELKQAQEEFKISKAKLEESQNNLLAAESCLLTAEEDVKRAQEITTPLNIKNLERLHETASDLTNALVLKDTPDYQAALGAAKKAEIYAKKLFELFAAKVTHLNSAIKATEDKITETKAKMQALRRNGSGDTNEYKDLESRLAQLEETLKKQQEDLQKATKHKEEWAGKGNSAKQKGSLLQTLVNADTSIKGKIFLPERHEVAFGDYQARIRIRANNNSPEPKIDERIETIPIVENKPYIKKETLDSQTEKAIAKLEEAYTRKQEEIEEINGKIDETNHNVDCLNNKAPSILNNSQENATRSGIKLTLTKLSNRPIDTGQSKLQMYNKVVARYNEQIQEAGRQVELIDHIEATEDNPEMDDVEIKELEQIAKDIQPKTTQGSDIKDGVLHNLKGIKNINTLKEYNGKYCANYNEQTPPKAPEPKLTDGEHEQLSPQVKDRYNTELETANKNHAAMQALHELKNKNNEFGDAKLIDGDVNVYALEITKIEGYEELITETCVNAALKEKVEAELEIHEANAELIDEIENLANYNKDSGNYDGGEHPIAIPNNDYQIKNKCNENLKQLHKTALAEANNNHAAMQALHELKNKNNEFGDATLIGGKVSVPPIENKKTDKYKKLITETGVNEALKGKVKAQLKSYEDNAALKNEINELTPERINSLTPEEFANQSTPRPRASTKLQRLKKQRYKALKDLEKLKSDFNTLVGQATKPRKATRARNSTAKSSIIAQKEDIVREQHEQHKQLQQIISEFQPLSDPTTQNSLTETERNDATAVLDEANTAKDEVEKQIKSNDAELAELKKQVQNQEKAADKTTPGAEGPKTAQGFAKAAKASEEERHAALEVARRLTGSVRTPKSRTPTALPKELTQT